MREASGRTGKEVGNALNTILSYMQRDTAISTFEDMGIEVFANTARTEFRNIMEVFEDLSKNWNTTSDTIKDGFIESADEAGLFSEEMAGALDLQEEWTGLQKRDASQAAAGVRRRNYFIALIDRFASSQEVLNGMLEAEGYTMEKNEIAMDTLEKKTESLKASAEALAVAIGDAGLTDALTAMADGGISALNAINNLPPGMRDAVVATSTLFLGIKALEMGMKTFGIQLPGVSQMIASLTSGTWSLAAALKAGTAGMIAFTKANAPLLLLTAVAGGIMAVRNAIKKSREEQEKAIQLFNEQKGTYAEVDKLVSSYEELASKSTLATEEQEKLLSIKEQIKNLLPESATALDSENMSLKDQVAIIKDLNEEQLENLKLKALDVFSDDKNKYEDDLKELEKLKKSLEEYQKWIDHFALKKLDQGKLSFIDAKEFERFVDNANRARGEIKELTAEIEAHEEAEKILTAIYEDNIDALIDMTDETENLDNAQSKNQETMDNLTKAYDEATAKLNAYRGFLDEIDSKEGLSIKSKDTIISKYHELLPYLSDEEELRRQIIQAMADEEQAKRDSYNEMLSHSEEYFTTLVGKNAWLRDTLRDYGIDQLEDVKTLAQAKLQIELALIKSLSTYWSKYYNATYGSMVFPDADTEQAFYGSAEGQKYYAVKRGLASLQNLSGSIDFGASGVSRSGGSRGDSGSSGRGSSASTREENTALNEALRLLEHKKRITEETHVTAKEEVETLYKINELYVKTADERMDMAERIYAAEKNYLAKRLQHSVDWINTKKNFNELSIEEEIAAWERVRAKQSDNNEALKQAELNLYNLRSKVRADNYKEEESTINHLTKLGILSVEKQIKAYKKLYEVKAESLEDERNRVENLFGLYQKLFSEQQSEIKDAYEERISQIEDEKTAKIEQINTELEAKKNAQNEVIKGIERELELLNKEESEYDHDKKMADLREQLAYWQVRTSENARKKVIELNKQIDEAEYKRELQLKRDSLQDEKEIAQDKISNLDDKSREQVDLAEKTAKDERDKWEKSYKLTEKAFDDHGTNIIALAGTMSEEAYKKWVKNYIDPMRKALSSGDYDSFSSSVGRLDESISGLETNVTDTRNAEVHRLASQILRYKRQYEVGGDKSAHERAKSVYEELSQLSPNVANNLSDMLYVNAKEYIAGLPKMHEGGKSLSFGAVEMMPGELVFPPDLSIRLENLIQALYQRPISGGSSISKTDNRKDVKIENLVRIDRNYMEDEVDSDMFAREIGRLVNRSF